MWVNMVSKLAARFEKSWRRNDTKEATNVHHGQRASGVLCAIDARRTDELYWKKFGHSIVERCKYQQTSTIKPIIMYCINSKLVLSDYSLFSELKCGCAALTTFHFYTKTFYINYQNINSHIAKYNIQINGYPPSLRIPHNLDCIHI